ncbi:MAG: glycosyl transferase [Erysipelotrichaceae bacterium]|nr:MAG: glycosyl [Erysipelotrichaceae bacterium]TXT18478.1 MAG: glycosyl transferase [Erysipelotrichaceae bacterium]
MEKKLISIISSCYNEGENIIPLYQSITEIMNGFPQYRYELLFADNGSSDDTAEKLEQIALRDAHVKVVINLKNYGPDRSGTYLIYKASGDAVICMASDFQDPPEMIPLFIQHWEQGHKLVWGQRTSTKSRKSMNLVRSLYYIIIAGLSENEEVKNANGFGLYDREIIDWIKWIDDPEPFIRNSVSSMGYKPFLVPFKQNVRRAGKSSYNFLRYMNDGFTAMVATTKVPLRVSTYLGLITATLCVVIGFVYFVLKIVYWESFNFGITPVLLGQFFTGAVQLVSLGIIGEYIGAILTRVKRRPMVIEKQSFNFTKDKPNSNSGQD